jgi:hypothetical protein
MAQQRKVIQNIEEATCENCIYSRPGKEKLYCARKFHADIGYDCNPGDWCGQGEWLTAQGEHVWVEKLMNLHRLFNTEEDCNHCFTGEGCGGSPKRCVTNETT